MTTGPFAVNSDSLTGLPSTPFSAKSGAFCPTPRALAPPASAALTRGAATAPRNSRHVRIGPLLVRALLDLNSEDDHSVPTDRLRSIRPTHPLSTGGDAPCLPVVTGGPRGTDNAAGAVCR